MPGTEVNSPPPRLGSIVTFCLNAGRPRVLALTALMTAVIAFADWWTGRDTSLGVLYILPMMVGSVVLPRAGILLLAVACAILRWMFYSPQSPITEDVLRFAFALLAYICSGLFMEAVVRNRQLVVEHLNELSQEQALRRDAEEQLRVLAESSPAGILTLDHQGTVLAANKATHSLFALAAHESLAGRPIRDYLPVLADALRLDIGGEGAEPFHTAAQCQGRRQNGEIFLAHTWFSTYRTLDGVRLAAIVVDTSEEMREREEHNLRQLSRHGRITAAAVSHEIRNLCSAITLLYSNAIDTGRAGREEEFQGLGTLVKGLGSIASLELRSRVQETLDPVPLRRVLDDLRIVIEPDWFEIDGTVRWNLPPEMPSVLADPHGLLQAFLNLLRTAIGPWKGVLRGNSPLS